MKIIFINACVRENSRTLALCRTYINMHFAESGCEIEELVLSQMKLLPLDSQALASRECDIEEQCFSSERYRPAKQFANADMILIGAPYWDCSFPAQLKLYFENICVNGITFGYGERGNPLVLCRAVRLVYITTAGGYIPKPSSAELHIKELCTMFGIPDVRFYCAEGLDIDENQPEDILNRTAREFCR